MTQLTDKHWAVEVPEGANGFSVGHFKNSYDHFAYYEGEASFGASRFLQLPPGSYRFLFTTKTATEEDARKVVEPYGKGWKDYNVYHAHKDIPYEFANDSLESLLRSKNLDPNKNYALIEKLKL